MAQLTIMLRRSTYGAAYYYAPPQHIWRSLLLCSAAAHMAQPSVHVAWVNDIDNPPDGGDFLEDNSPDLKAGP